MSSSSSDSEEEVDDDKRKKEQAKLIRQISESLSSYSIEAAHKEAGVTTPAKVQSPAKPKLSLSSTEDQPPKKKPTASKKLPLQPKQPPKPKKQLEIPKPVQSAPAKEDEKWDSLSSDDDEAPVKPKPLAAPEEEEDDEFSRFLKAQPTKLRKSSTGEHLASAVKKTESYPNLFG